jgi:hypothetical protein
VSDYPKATKVELEKAYALVNELEKELVADAQMARGILFAEIQANVLDQNPPKFDKGATMTQAFRMGLDRGVDCVLNAVDTRSILMIDGNDRMLNVDITSDGPDMLPLVDLWASYINS